MGNIPKHTKEATVTQAVEPNDTRKAIKTAAMEATRATAEAVTRTKNLIDIAQNTELNDSDETKEMTNPTTTERQARATEREEERTHARNTGSSLEALKNPADDAYTTVFSFLIGFERRIRLALLEGFIQGLVNTLTWFLKVRVLCRYFLWLTLTK